MVTILFDINKLLWLTLILASYDYRQFCGLDDIYCLFLGSLNNLWSLLKQYGLSKGTNEAMFVIEAYKTLRDRGPYPADQVLKDLDGSFAFVVYDSKVGTVFAALVIKLDQPYSNMFLTSNISSTYYFLAITATSAEKVFLFWLAFNFRLNQ